MSQKHATLHAILSLVDLEKLSAPFALQALEWRVVRLSPDKMSAQVRPQLRLEAVRRRLDEVCGALGWSNSFTGVGDGAVACTLTCALEGAELHRSAVAARAPQGDPVSTAEDAFVYAAEALGMRPPVSAAQLPWVDYNLESGEILFEPDLSELGAASEPPAEAVFGGATPSVGASSVSSREGAPSPELPTPPPSSVSPLSAPPTPQDPAPSAPKPAGQQAIDRLLERLRAEGLGLQAAKLVVQYGGYGADPAAAKELYAQLRALLLSRPDPDEAA